MLTLLPFQPSGNNNAGNEGYGRNDQESGLTGFKIIVGGAPLLRSLPMKSVPMPMPVMGAAAVKLKALVNG